MTCHCTPDPYLAALNRIAAALERCADAWAGPRTEPGLDDGEPLSAGVTDVGATADRTPPELNFEAAVMATLQPLISDIFGGFGGGGRR